MEPERKIEKVLRAFVKKRRDEAGAPLEMHPATRRLLQSEVARHAPKPDRGHSPSSWLANLQFGSLINLLVVVAIIAILSAMLLPALSKAKYKAKGIAKINEERQREVRRQLEAEAADAAARPAASPPALEPSKKRDESDQLALERQSGAKLEIVSDNVSVSNGEASSRLFLATNSMETGSVALYDESLRLAQTNGLPVTTATAAILVAEDTKRRTDGFGTSADKPQLDAEGRSGIAGVAGDAAQRFRRVPVNGPVTATVSNPPVLLAFTLEQSNQMVRVVDGDGSVYVGLLVSGPADGSAVAPRETPMGGMGGERSYDALGKDVGGQSTYSFRVTGTNRSLNRNVVFTGNVTTAINNKGLFQQTNQFGAPAPGASAQLPVSSGLRISGTAVIDDVSKVEILAVPAIPLN